MSKRKLEYKELFSFEDDIRNPKAHDLDAIGDSIDRFGYVEPVVVDSRTNKLVSGHGRIAQLRTMHERGEEPPDGIEEDKDGNWLVPATVWESKDDAEAAAYIIAANRTTELGGWDDKALVKLLAEISETDLGLSGVGYSDKELVQFLARLQDREQKEGLTDKDDVPEIREAAICRPGDLWKLGPHYLRVGDSTDPKAVKEVMGGVKADMIWTDPPYGVSYVGKTQDALTIENDDLDDDMLRDLLGQAFTYCIDNSKPGAVWFVAGPSGPLSVAFGSILLDLGILRQTLVWVKNSLVMGHGDYHYRHELLSYGWTPGGSHQTPPDRTWDSIWEVDRPSRSTEHPTMKPVDLISRAVLNHTTAGQHILDPFGGSGSTLISSEETGRIAHLIELSPVYCDVICRRYQEFTGTLPVLTNSGEPIDFGR